MGCSGCSDHCQAPKELHVLDGPEALLLLLGQHSPGGLVRDGAHLPVDDVLLPVRGAVIFQESSLRKVQLLVTPPLERRLLDPDADILASVPELGTAPFPKHPFAAEQRLGLLPRAHIGELDHQLGPARRSVERCVLKFPSISARGRSAAYEMACLTAAAAAPFSSSTSTVNSSLQADSRISVAFSA